MDKEKQIILELCDDGVVRQYKEPFCTIACQTEEAFERFNYLIRVGQTAEALNSKEEWYEDYGNCLWWRFPIEEEPYVGTPLDENFPSDVTHFTKIIIPKEPK